MSVFATLRRSVGFGGGAGGSTSTLPITNKSTSMISDELQNDNKGKHDISTKTLANLCLENKHGKHKATYPIRKQVTKIGRLATNDIRIYRETVSRVHCEVHVRVEESKVTASLHIFNPKGLKINGSEIDKESKGERIVTLLDGDLIEIYSNYFRMRLDEFDSDKENEENVPLSSSNTVNQGRKSIRMSLVRSKVNQKIQSDETASSSTSVLQKNATESERMPLGTLSCAKLGQANAENSHSQAESKGPFAQPSSNKTIPKQGRRSLVFATPKRESISQQPWTAEPIKRVQRPISPKKISKAPENEAEGDDSIVFMEEIEEENDKDAEFEKDDGMLPNELDDLLAVAPIVGPDTIKEEQTSIDSSSYARQTKSVSPKKVKRRSSFFGRAGVFANWNFGFYPEERKAAEEEDIEKELSPSPSLSPITSPNGTRYLPDPRLDSQGRPRLPRSLSSPEGFSHSSPKRRIVSLRTATLLRQGQNAFEQQKMRSPPSSPTKSSLSNDSTPSLMGQMQQLLSIVNQPKDSSDADDEDEIDQSLSLADDEPEEVIEEPKRTLTVSKPRKSDSSAVEGVKQAIENRKSRVSMPAKLLSIISVDGHSNADIEDLKNQWLAEQEERDDEEEEDLKEIVQDTLAKQEQGHETDTDSENESEDEIVKEKEEVQDPATPSSKMQYGMLRYMVRENAELTALLDTVANTEGEKATGNGQETKEMPAEVALLADAEMKEESMEEKDVTTAADGEWQIVSPRRARWEPSERKAIENRRVSDTFAAQKKQKVISPKKKSQRRVTAAAVSSSIPVSSVSHSKSLSNEKVTTEVQPSEYLIKLVAETSAASATSPIEDLQMEQQTVEQKSPKKRSPSKKSPVKKSPVKPKMSHRDSTAPTKVTEEEIITLSSDVVVVKNEENPVKAIKEDVRSPLKSISPSKKVNNTVATTPIPCSPKRLRSRSPVKRTEAEAEEDDDKENEIPIALQSSSPVKKTRSTIKTTQSRGRKKAKEESEMESEPVEKTAPSTRRSTRTTKKTLSLDVPASEPAMPISESDVRTTRSGRSVRKPKDLTQPKTVIAVQSDPVEPTNFSSGRMTRNRTRKGTAA